MNFTVYESKEMNHQFAPSAHGSHAVEVLKQPFALPIQLCAVAFRVKNKLNGSSGQDRVCRTDRALLTKWEVCPNASGSLVLGQFEPPPGTQPSRESSRDTAAVPALLRICL